MPIQRQVAAEPHLNDLSPFHHVTEVIGAMMIQQGETKSAYNRWKLAIEHPHFDAGQLPTYEYEIECVPL